MDLVLELFDGQGKLVAKANANSKAAGEAITHVAISPGRHYLRVRPFWIKGHVVRSPDASISKDPSATSEAAYVIEVHWTSTHPAGEA